MKKFIFKFIIFILLFASLYSLIIIFNIYIVGNQYTKSYNAAILDKINLLNSISEPKIILVGNSNLSFGIDSKLMEEELNMPVVNLGLHGGLGNIFLENMAKENISSNDIVVLVHTEYDSTGLIGDYDLAWITIEKNINLYKFIDKNDYINMAKSYTKYNVNSFKKFITHTGNKDSNDQYSRSAFNEYGDIVKRTLFLKSNDIFYSGCLMVSTLSDDTIDRLNSYNDFITSKGAHLVIAAPPIPDGEYTPNRSEWKKLESSLNDKLNIDIISNFEDYFMTYDYFLDTKYHLTDEGVKKRTKLLIDDLKKWKESTYKKEV
ncbi:MAG: hypothetical protein IJ565_03230 [Bacilli bacterium]|nr:hypothetical protein [Bacilli bacterium]